MKINFKRGASIISIYLILTLIVGITIFFIMQLRSNNEVFEIEEDALVDLTDDIVIIKANKCEGLEFGFRRIYKNENGCYLQIFVTNNTGRIISSDESFCIVKVLDDSRKEIIDLGLIFGELNPNETTIGQTVSNVDFSNGKYLEISR